MRLRPELDKLVRDQRSARECSEMNSAKLVLAIPLVLSLSANSQCVLKTDEDDDDDESPKTQQHQPSTPQNGEAPGAEVQ